jgi:hypothetical protein
MKKYTFPTCFFVIFTFFQHHLGHFLTLFQLYIITTNRPLWGRLVWNSSQMGCETIAKWIDVQSRWCGGTHNFTLATLAKISSALGESIITI